MCGFCLGGALVLLAERWLIVGGDSVVVIDRPPPPPPPPRFIVRSPVAPEPGLPLVAFSLKERGVGYDEFDVAEVLREHGWVVPAYPLAKGAQQYKVLRVVCREDFSPGLAASLARHVVEAVEKLEKQAARVGAAVRASGAWRAAVNRTHSLARASAKAKGAAVTDNGVDYVGRHGGAC